MKHKFLALVIDHDRRYGGPMKAVEFMAKTDAIKRLLDATVIVKELAPGLLTFDLTQKDKAIAAVADLKSDYNCTLTSSLHLTFAEIQSIEDEFAPWYYLKMETDNDELEQEELEANMSDMMEMTLEKG
jgi:hypothetical protein